MQSSFKSLRITLIVLLLVSLISFASPINNDNPKLVVFIAVDQFRAGYLERYGEVFKGGFRRLLDEGWRYDKALVEHAPTLSWPGHTTIATGAHPKTHGISDNEWIVDTGHRRLIFQDDSEQIIGYPKARSFSPKITRVTGIADWIRAADPEAMTISLATSSIALCYGGKPNSEKSKNHVYWIEPPAGEFVSTTYYRDDYPDWIDRFNKEVLPQYKEKLVWENSVPDNYRFLARVDEAPYEYDGIHTTFPHKIEDFYRDVNQTTKNYWFANYSPYANEALFALAKESINELALGQRSSTDFLAIGIKSTDRIGHDFGPRSLEQLDNILRIDRELAKFFDFLDKTIGKENYIITLSADHGAPNIVEYELEQGNAAKRVSEQDIKNVLADIEKFIDIYSGPEEKLPALIARELEKADFIAKAMTPEDLSGSSPADRTLYSYRNSYIPGHKTTFPLWTNDILRGTVSPHHPGNYGIIVEYIKNGQLYTARSAHASAYNYDQEVPIVFMGSGIKKGVAKESARTIDIAPTLSNLAGVSFPKTVDGKVLKVR